jgi:ATP adenylyltransferase
MSQTTKWTNSKMSETSEHGRQEEERPVLWAPWRMRYIEEEKAARCIFCGSLEEETLREQLTLVVTSHSRVMLNKYPYTNGHVMVAPRRHTAVLAELSAVEFADLMGEVRRAVAILDRILHPQGMNVGLNLGTCAGAGIADHLHWHVVPRWNGDTNFMPVIGSVRVMPQHLFESYDQLRPHFSSPSPAVIEGSSPLMKRPVAKSVRLETSKKPAIACSPYVKRCVRISCVPLLPGHASFLVSSAMRTR